MMDSVPANPHIWMWTLGPATPETMERFGRLTAVGEVNWIIIPLPSGNVEDLTLPPGYHPVEHEGDL